MRSRAKGGGEFELGYLDCVAEAAGRGGRELDRLKAAARKIAELPGIVFALQMPEPEQRALIPRGTLLVSGPMAASASRRDG